MVVDVKDVVDGIEDVVVSEDDVVNVDWLLPPLIPS